MSRGFVKEGDQEETPLVPPRAHLPDGVHNYVTTQGLNELLKEQQGLLDELRLLQEKGHESNRIQINYLKAKMQLLEVRINTAQVVDLAKQPKDEVRFGATVTLLKETDGCQCHYQIVGVDEAKKAEHKVSFLSPIAKLLTNKRVGDEMVLRAPKGEVKMKVLTIKYDQP